MGFRILGTLYFRDVAKVAKYRERKNTGFTVPTNAKLLSEVTMCCYRCHPHGNVT